MHERHLRQRGDELPLEGQGQRRGFLESAIGLGVAFGLLEEYTALDCLGMESKA